MHGEDLDPDEARRINVIIPVGEDSLSFTVASELIATRSTPTKPPVLGSNCAKNKVTKKRLDCIPP